MNKGRYRAARAAKYNYKYKYKYKYNKFNGHKLQNQADCKEQGARITMKELPEELRLVKVLITYI